MVIIANEAPKMDDPKLSKVNKESENETYNFSDVKIADNIISIGSNNLNIYFISNVEVIDYDIYFNFFSRLFTIRCANEIEINKMIQALENKKNL